ncbi:hypothetical protein AVEN_145586-1 [Araneus ventricosus]|uniref:Uncharacterized protein n=1 Tax=Araneus ventricosus TaxID=182803 RepID=A0A4Y2S9R1_ARAVE|nr:hypothetical protein AVEN_145586-1 [Araneus ventricosus]
MKRTNYSPEKASRLRTLHEQSLFSEEFRKLLSVLNKLAEILNGRLTTSAKTARSPIHSHLDSAQPDPPRHKKTPHPSYTGTAALRPDELQRAARKDLAALLFKHN